MLERSRSDRIGPNRLDLDHWGLRARGCKAIRLGKRHRALNASNQYGHRGEYT
jgi:hypothetical protein